MDRNIDVHSNNFLVMGGQRYCTQPDYDGASAPVLFGGSMSDIDSFEDSAPSDVAITIRSADYPQARRRSFVSFSRPMMIPAASHL